MDEDRKTGRGDENPGRAGEASGMSRGSEHSAQDEVEMARIEQVYR